MNTSQDSPENLPPQESSMSLFEKMLEKQLKEEEERMKQQGLPITHQTETSQHTESSSGKSDSPPAQVEKTDPVDDKMDISAEESSIVAGSQSHTEERPIPSSNEQRQSSSTSVTPSSTSPSSSMKMDEGAGTETDLPPPVDSMSLFEKMLEEQLKQEQKGTENLQNGSGQDNGDGATLQDRFRSNQWKERMSAFEELSALFESKADSPADPVFEEYATFIPSIVGEKNAIALDKGMETVLHFVNNYKHSATKSADEIIPLLIQKPLTSAKQTTQKNAKEIIMTLLEQCQDKVHLQRCVMEMIITNQLHPAKQRNKVTKVRAAVVNLLIECVSGFGIEMVGASSILKCLPSLYGETDRKIRAETMALLLELYRWLREGISPYLQSMRDVQRKELESEFETIKNEPAPTASRSLRALQPKHVVNTASKLASRTATQPSTRPREITANDSTSPNVKQNNGPTASAPRVELDIFDISEPSPVIPKLTNTFFEGIISSKWLERKEALEELNKLARKPRLVTDNYGDISTKIATIIEKDANVPVTKSAIEVVESLCKGLRKDFSFYARQILPHLIQRFKMKQQVICDSVHNALKAMILTKDAPVLFTEFITSPILEDAVLPCLKSKVPTQRAHILRFLQHGLEFTTRKPDSLLNGMEKKRSSSAYKKSIRTLATHIVAMCDDPNSQVRDVCFQILAIMTMGKQSGCDCSREVQPLLKDFDKVKLEKINEIRSAGQVSDISTSSAGMDGKSTTEGIAPRSQSRPKMSVSETSSGATKRHRSALSSISRTPSSVSSSSSSGQKQAMNKSKSMSTLPVENTIDDAEGTSANMSKETAMSNFSVMFASVANGSFVEQMGSPKWSARLETVEQLAQYVHSNKNHLFSKQGSGKLPTEVTEVLVKTLSSVTKNWKESNVQVLGKIFSLIGWLGVVKLHEGQEDEKIVVTINRGIASLLIGPLLDKIATAKIKEVVKECLTQLSEVVTPQFVSTTMWSALEKQRNPKIIAESISWLTDALVDFHIKQWKIDELIGFARKCLENTNPGVKKATTSLICMMYRYTGASLLNYLKDIKSTLLTQIQKEIEKQEDAKPEEPTRFVYSSKMLRQLAKKREGGNDVMDESDGAMEDEDDIMPRTDISSHLTPKILKMLGEENWKNRMEALRTIEKIIVQDGNKRITPNIVELMKALRQRLDKDSTVMVVTTVASLVKHIAEALGPSSSNIERYSKFVLPILLGKQMFDQKRQVRQAAMEAVETWCRFVTIGPMLKFCAKALINNDSKKGNPEGRKELLRFMSDKIQEEKQNESRKELLTSHVDVIVKPLVHTLMDPKSENRKYSETILSDIVTLVGEDEVKKHLRDMKPAIRETVSSILEKCFTASRNAIIISKRPQPNHETDGNTMEIDDDTEGDSGETSPPPAKRPRKGSLHSRSQSSGGKMASHQQQQQISEPVENVLALLENSMKEHRARKERKNRWYFNERDQPLRPEQVEALKESMQHCVPSVLLFALFDNNQKQEQGMQCLVDFLSDKERCSSNLVIQNVDVILHYCSLKIYDQSNTKLQLKSLDLILRLTSILQEVRYKLSDYESTSFLPIFLDRLGHNIVIIRETMKKIVKIFCQICHPKKMLNYLLEGAKLARNPKTRFDCLSEIVYLIEQYGLSNLFNNASYAATQQVDTHFQHNHSASSVYITVSKCTHDPDNNVKIMAFQVLQTACRESQATSEQIQHIISSCPDNTLAPKVKQTVIDKLKKVKPLQRDEIVQLRRQQQQRFLRNTLSDSELSELGVTPASEIHVQQRQQKRQERRDQAKVMKQFSSGEYKLNLEEIELAVPMQPKVDIPSISATGTTSSSSSNENHDINTSSSDMEVSSGEDSSMPNTRKDGPALERYQTQESGRKSASRQPLSTGSTFVVTGVSQPNSIDALLSDVNNFRQNSELAVNALKRLVEIFKQENGRTVVPHLRDLIRCVAENIQVTFREIVIPAEENIDGSNPNRICKYLLNTMMQLFSHRTIVEFVAKDTLQYLIDLLLLRMLDEKLPKLEEGVLLKALNTLMLRILENSNRTHTYTSLINLLADSSAVDYEQLPNENSRLIHKKYMELVVKCLLKLTKALSMTIERIDIDILLSDLHEFLTNNPPTQFKGRDDMPLRTIKTILNELVKVKGSSIRTYLNLIPTHRNPLIVSYIDLMLSNGRELQQQQQQKQKHPTFVQAERTIDDVNGEGNTPDAQNANIDQQSADEYEYTTSQVSQDGRTMLRKELTDIFACISNKETTQHGLFQLYRFQQRNPNINLQPFLQKCSEPFQAYIKRQLSKIEQHEKAKAETAAANAVTPTRSVTPAKSVTPARTRNIASPSSGTRTSSGGVKSSIRPASAPRLRPTFTGFDGNITKQTSSPQGDDSSPAPLTSIREPGNSGMSSVDAIRARLRLRNMEENGHASSPGSLKERLANVEKMSPVSSRSADTTAHTALDLDTIKQRLQQHRLKEEKDLSNEDKENKTLATTTSQALSSLRERLARIRTGNMDVGQQ